MNSETSETILFQGHPALLGSVNRLLIAILTLGIGVIYFWFQDKNTNYLITSERIVIESGIFSRKIDTIELYMVNDMELNKPFAQRLMGTGNLTVISEDHTNPVIHLLRLPLDVRQLYEKLRLSIKVCKQSRQGYYRET
jgi:uncharacterized membrane protein YdbT with pleckstrin-like domain